jgi:3-isopropylmalate dehydratase/3-isopropylmalate/(R)-2-methylmalate dehydratase small subunit
MDEAKGGNHVFSVDLAAQTVTAPSGQAFHFDIDPTRKAKLLEGLDSIGETLAHAPDIDAYEYRHALAEPWLERA